jgi:hypothetical protein
MILVTAFGTLILIDDVLQIEHHIGTTTINFSFFSKFNTEIWNDT